MQRRKDIAGTPSRTPADAWAAIAELVTATLDRSNSIDTTTVGQAMEQLRPAGVALIAAGHLSRQPLTVVAAPLTLDIWVVSGEAALELADTEDLAPVRGAATATVWTIHLPRPDGLAALIDEVTDAVDPATTATATTRATASGQAAAPTTTTGDVVDLRRLTPGGH